jgi:hypothetical protein
MYFVGFPYGFYLPVLEGGVLKDAGKDYLASGPFCDCWGIWADNG